jgi:hypothetical protein
MRGKIQALVALSEACQHQARMLDALLCAWAHNVAGLDACINPAPVCQKQGSAVQLAFFTCKQPKAHESLEAHRGPNAG